MGYYINAVPKGRLLPLFKAQALLEFVEGAKTITPPKNESDWVPDMVCVVENADWDAAAYAFSSEEMMAFAQEDGRKKQWLIVPGASNFSGYKG